MIKKTLHIVLSALILLSSSGLIINKHYCLDQLVSVAVMSEAEACHVKIPGSADQPFSSQENIAPKDCCKDTSTFFKTNQEKQAENLAASLIDDSSLDGVVLNSIQILNLSSALSYSTSQRYKPPLLVWDRSIHLQTFLC